MDWFLPSPVKCGLIKSTGASSCWSYPLTIGRWLIIPSISITIASISFEVNLHLPIDFFREALTLLMCLSYRPPHQGALGAMWFHFGACGPYHEVIWRAAAANVVALSETTSEGRPLREQNLRNASFSSLRLIPDVSSIWMALTTEHTKIRK